MGSERDDRIAAVGALALGSRAIERSLDDMTLPQFRVLTLIDHSPERASRIAEKASVSRPSLTGLLDGLEQRGWVRRVQVHGDRRGVGLELTSSGRTALRRAQRASADHLDEILSHLDVPDRHAAIDGLQALGRAFAARAMARS